MNKIVSLIAMLSLSLTLLLTAVLTVGTDAPAWIREQRRLDVYDSVGMAAEDVDEAMARIAGYLSGRRADFQLEAELNGVRQPVFRDSEIAHMADVRNLYRLGRAVAACGALVFAAGFVFVLRRAASPWRTLRWGLLAGWSAALALGALGLIFGSALSFDQAFLLFHRLLFRNELWLMNPATDAMIRMLPGAFFEAMAGQIAVRSALLLATGCPGAMLLARLIQTGRSKERGTS